MFSNLQNRVVELCVKLNQADLLNDLQYLDEVQWLGAYFMLQRLHGG